MQTLGTYTLLHKLGHGGMGEVWSGERPTLGGGYKRVAIKLLLPERARDASSRKLFLDEARLSMLLSHSNIVQVFDVDQTEDGACYMAMEWVQGLSLAELSAAHEGPLSTTTIAFIIGQILSALAYAHDIHIDGARQTIVHRDVSPHNVMISLAGEVKLMDFGIARLASEETSGRHVRGKLRYMPPEQLRGETREPSIDLFAVGAILHELLDGRKFRGDSIDESRLFGMILDGEIPPLERASELPAQLEQLRLALLSKDASDRPASAREAHELLCSWPGYRNTSFELADLAASIARSRLELTATTQLSAISSQTLSDSQTEPSSLDVSLTRIEAPRFDDRVEPEAARRRLPLRWAAGIAAVSLCAGLLGAGFVSRSTEQLVEAGASLIEDGREDPGAAEPPSVVEATAPAPEPAPPPVNEPPPSEPSPPIPVTAPTPEPAPPVETAAAKPKQSTAIARAKVEVQFLAGELMYAEIKVGGRRLVLEPASTARLPVGTHTIRYRQAPDAKWTRAGTITLEAGASYRAKLRDPKGVELTKQG